MDRYAADRNVKRLSKSTGITRRISPHSLRRSFIVAALDAGFSLRAVQQAASQRRPRERPLRALCLGMREERVEFNEVPAKIYRPESASALLLFGHGGTHSKDSPGFVTLCRTYAEATGLAVVCMDAVAHGERSIVDASPSVPQHWHSSTAAQMVNDWQRCADGFSSIGPPVAYVGFSMGMIFGASTVASMPTIRAAVFGVGGIPGGSWIDDPPREYLLLSAAANLGNVQLLMVNVTHDELFPTEGTHRFFNAVPGRQKRLMFWEGGHDDWPLEAHEHSIRFVTHHTRPA